MLDSTFDIPLLVMSHIQIYPVALNCVVATLYQPYQPYGGVCGGMVLFCILFTAPCMVILAVILNSLKRLLDAHKKKTACSRPRFGGAAHLFELNEDKTQPIVLTRLWDRKTVHK